MSNHFNAQSIFGGGTSVKLPEWNQLTDAEKNTGFRVRRDDWTGTLNTPPISITVIGDGPPRHWHPYPLLEWEAP